MGEKVLFLQQPRRGERRRRALRRWPGMVFVVALLAASQASAAPPVTPQQLSSDPFTSDGAQHATQVEPDSFSFGQTVVTAFQSGRFFSGGGASAIGVATSQNSGSTWSSGFLPSLTVATGGTYDRATDPAVAYDAKHDVWLISSLALNGPFTSPASATTAYAVNRSTNGGLNWSAPIVASPANPAPPPTLAHDKGWIACDNSPTSTFYGNCYLAYSDFVNGRASVVRSADGGLGWSAPVGSADSAGGVGVQPVVQPNGTVIVPLGLGATGMRSIRSTDGGVTFQASVSIAVPNSHAPTRMRALPVPSAEVDGSGTVYLAWQDCRFRAGCPNAPNDIVYVTSSDGITWSAVQRVPIDRLDSGVDHFIPGLGVDTATSGAGANLALTYYYYPDFACTEASCRLNVGFVSSKNGGAHWSRPRTLNATPMPLSWLADTAFGAGNGRMVGDYISTSFVTGSSIAVPVFSLATAAPVGSAFTQSIWAAAIKVEANP
jgi:hypothetical protein